METLIYLSRKKDYAENVLDAIVLTPKSLIIDMGDHVLYYKRSEAVMKILAKYRKTEDVLYRDKAMKIVNALDQDVSISPYRTMVYNIVDEDDEPVEPNQE